MPDNVIDMWQQINGNVWPECGEPRRVRCTPWAWDRDCQHAFIAHKQTDCNAPVPTVLYSDAKYSHHIYASKYALHAVPFKIQDLAEKRLGYISCALHYREMRYPVYSRETLIVQDATVYWIFNLHRAKQQYLVQMKHEILHWILTRPHLTVCQMDTLEIPNNHDWEVKHILHIWYQGLDTCVITQIFDLSDAM